jgi:hypothetical protein
MRTSQLPNLQLFSEKIYIYEIKGSV